MVSLAGASAAYPGYQTARQADNVIAKGDIDVENARIEQQGNEALGRTIAAYQQSQMPGAQPIPQMQPGFQPGMGAGQPRIQTPAPGQPSVPMQQGPQAQGFTPGPTGMPPQMQSPGFQPPGGQPAAMASLPGGAGGIDALRGKLDVKTLMGAISAANPGAPPAVLAAAMNKAMPLLTAQAQMDWKTALMADRTARTGIAQDRADIAGEEATRKKEQGAQRLEQGQQRIDQQGGELASRAERRQAQTSQGAERIDIAKGREARLAAAAQVRQDQRWQQLEQQKAALAERIRSSNDRSAISQWRAIVDAQHKRAMEIIQSSNINANLSETDKKALIKEQNDFYESQIKEMRDRQGNSTGRPAASDTSNRPEQPKVPDRVPQGATNPPVGQRPRAKNPETGEEVEYDGQNWVPVPGKQSLYTPQDNSYGGREEDPLDRLRTRHFQRQKRQFSSEPLVG